MARLESDFKARVVKHIREELLPGCILTMGNSASLQGIPDVFIVYHDKWAMLEFKKTANAVHQPNQDYYVDMLNDWSFAAFIFPENAEDVLHALEQALRPRRKARLSQR
jgi:hypothetical protein